MRPDWRDTFPAFCDAVYKRLAQGEVEYKNATLAKGPQKCLSEAVEELYDLMAYLHLAVSPKQNSEMMAKASEACYHGWRAYEIICDMLEEGFDDEHD